MSGLLLLVLAFLLARLLGRRLAAPLEAISRDAAVVSAGGPLPRFFAIGGRDEIATLACAMDSMVENLTRARETLEERVRERTDALYSSQVLLASIVENIPHSIGVRDLRPGGRTLLWNRAAEEIFGIERQAVFAGQVSPLESLVVQHGGTREFPPRGGAGKRSVTFAILAMAARSFCRPGR